MSATGPRIGLINHVVSPEELVIRRHTGGKCDINRSGHHRGEANGGAQAGQHFDSCPGHTATNAAPIWCVVASAMPVPGCAG
jgi:hypothetical protein